MTKRKQEFIVNRLRQRKDDVNNGISVCGDWTRVKCN